MPVYSKETALYDTGKIATDIGTAGNTAKGYMTEVSGDNGVFVHEYDLNEPQPSTAGANGVHITSDVDIIRDGKVAASYGDSAKFYDTDGITTLAEFGASGARIKTNDMIHYGTTVFEVETSGVQKHIYQTVDIMEELDIEDLYTLDFSSFPSSETTAYIGLSVWMMDHGKRVAQSVTVSITIGQAISEDVYFTYTDVTEEDISCVIHINITADGVFSVTSVSPSTGTAYVTSEYILRIVYVSYEVNTPYYTLGLRNGNAPGAYSAIIGEGLTADWNNQIALGKYNLNNTISNLLTVGNGTSAENLSNALTLTNSGDLTVARSIYAYGHDNAIGNVIEESQTAVVIAPDKTRTHACFVGLTPGTWIITGELSFAAASTGRRWIGITDEDDNAIAFVQHAPATGGVTRMQVTAIVYTIDSPIKYFYLKGWQAQTIAGTLELTDAKLTAVCIA